MCIYQGRSCACGGGITVEVDVAVLHARVTISQFQVKRNNQGCWKQGDSYVPVPLGRDFPSHGNLVPLTVEGRKICLNANVKKYLT